MIRPATLADAPAIAAIYNHYIVHSTATFEVEPVSVEEMCRRIAGISAHCPYLVDEQVVDRGIVDRGVLDRRVLDRRVLDRGVADGGAVDGEVVDGAPVVRAPVVVTGYSYAHPWKERAAFARTWETTVYVAPAYQHRGIGRALMLRLIDDCRRRGAHALVACITQGNEASYDLHRQLGFRQASAFPEVGWKFNRWLGVVDWELILDPVAVCE